jgi:hypothetical protein
MARPKAEGLQKLTEIKIKRLLRRTQITHKDIDQLSDPERRLFGDIVTEKIKSCTPDERDTFLKKIEETLSEQTRTEFWEYNHNRIMAVIPLLMKELGRLPSRTEIARKAELSRTTVYKHLTEFANHPLYLEQLQKFRILAENVLVKVYQSAMDGDTASQKMMLNVMGLNCSQSSQTNYIQINNLILSQDQIRRLNPEQLLTIESILRTIIPQPELKTIDQNNITTAN